MVTEFSFFLLQMTLMLWKLFGGWETEPRFIALKNVWQLHGG